MNENYVRLLVQPEDGAGDIIKAVDRAEESVDILIFRFDIRELEHALVRAVQRGVRVRAMVAHTSRGGEKSLRSLEQRLPKAGVTVSRTAEDLIRYHGKMMIVDGKELYVLGFNFTYLDIDRSRSFGLVMGDRKLIGEALALFEADMARQIYTPKDPRFVVSPVNARQAIASFLEGATQELIIYDLNLSDASIARVLKDRAKAGVSIRILGGSTRLPYHKLAGQRLHIRAIVRDGNSLFLGSQSLRAVELDKRREIGVILERPKIAAAIKAVFEKDWEASKTSEVAGIGVPATKIAKRMAKAVAKELPPLSDVLAAVVKEVAGEEAKIPISQEAFETGVKDAVKQAVKEAVREAVEEGEPA